jgi:glycosyltransferase involved in cell wall biosynthesis
MLIGIDGNEANVERRVGSNLYSFELLWGFKKQGAKAAVYLKNKPLTDMPPSDRFWQYRVVGPKILWTQLALPWALFQSDSRPDVFFTPGHYSPRWSPCPAVMAILDLAYIHFPQMFRRQDLWQLRQWTGRSARRAERILTISQASKNAIIDYYSLSPDKVAVIYPGLKIMKKRSQVDLKQYGIKGDYLLYVGTLQPRKNLSRLIEAFKLLSVEFPQLSLVIVGKKGWLYEQIFKKVKDLGLKKRIIFTGFVPDEVLPTLYQKARCFVLVSLYEGFGLPVLEAMAYGCPVVASKVSSLPEVAGKAGVLVDPESVDDIARGIKEALKKRKGLIRRGRRQAKKFSWEKCARETLAVLENVASQR